MAMARRNVEPEASKAGFFGKAPSHGDFVSNRFDRQLRERFDFWLQRAISESRRRLGDDWEAAFAKMPVWRFALGSEVTGGKPAIGVLAASADRVGRAFPLILAARVQGFEGPTRALCGCEAWHGAAEALIGAVGDEDFDLDLFDDEVAGLPAPDVDLDDAPDGARPDRDRSFWWREDKGEVRGARFASVGLPAPAEFHRLLAAPAPEEPRPATAAAAPLPVAAPRPPAVPLVFEAAVASNAGTRLRINADAWTSRPGIHAVADGVGDLPSAAEASRLTLAKLRAVEAGDDPLDDLIQRTKGALGQAHAILRAGAPDDEDRPNASVVALVAAEGRFAVLWAGDARCYLVRGALMRRLTRDHVEVGIRRALVRSVGGPAQLSLEAASGELEDGDRFLLCSNPLVVALNERAVADAMEADSPRAAADRLVQDALIAGVAGNVTAMTLHVRPA